MKNSLQNSINAQLHLSKDLSRTSCNCKIFPKLPVSLRFSASPKLVFQLSISSPVLDVTFNNSMQFATEFLSVFHHHICSLVQTSITSILPQQPLILIDMIYLYVIYFTCKLQLPNKPISPCLFYLPSSCQILHRWMNKTAVPTILLENVIMLENVLPDSLFLCHLLDNNKELCNITIPILCMISWPECNLQQPILVLLHASILEIFNLVT